jgi:N-acetylglucosaminyldiphosphoundecaprenol N-acetyl-beta-D-mannosaminyltransferase
MGAARPSEDPTPPLARHHLLGVWVDGFTVETFFALIRARIAERRPCVIGHHNLHSVYLYHHDPEMKAFYTQMAEFVFIDGMPLALWGRLLGLGLSRANRFTSVDWLPPLMEMCAAEGLRVFYLGGRPGVAERGAERLRERFPALALATAHGYFDPDDDAANRAILAEIEAWKTDLLLVGMGMPRQERWILRWRAVVTAPVIVPVGAALDYVAGAIPTPSRQASRWGLEWLLRLLAEPRRLGNRYLIEPWFLLPYAARDVVGRVTKRRPPSRG